MSARLPITQNGPHFVCATELEGVTYSITYRWNDREGAWFMDIADSLNTPLLSGIKIVINTLLLGRATADGLPSGDFVAFDTAGQNDDAGYADLGRRVVVTYFTADELSS